VKTERNPARLSEDDIRPEHLNAAKEAAYSRDVARLLLRRGEFVAVACPACGAEDGTAEWRKYELTYLRCGQCRTVYVSPRPSPPVLEEYYRTSELYEYWNKYIFPASEEARRERIMRPRLARLLDICERFKAPHRTLVEIGPGFGTFAQEALASAEFQRVTVIEPAPSLAETCRSRGLDVIEKPIEQVTLPEGGADVVVAFEVIEHLFSPRDFVAACARNVVRGGLLVLTCPNGMGFEVEVLDTVADTIDTEHLNYFNPDSLSRLLTTAGFEVLEASTPGVLDADIVRNKVLGGKFDLTGQRFLEIVLLERWDELGGPFQDFLKGNRLSSHMWIVGRRPA
jgi:2-polyprenyl-3-methyl-5-hydroxy-6-metoxy-1,4-benzoquinol methylase/Zn ribbon nucleic-acid-binding protein